MTACLKEQRGSLRCLLAYVTWPIKMQLQRILSKSLAQFVLDSTYIQRMETYDNKVNNKNY